MGQKVRPTGFRVGVYDGWRSRWYASKHEFKDLLVEDFKIREYVKKKYAYAAIPKIEIERTRDKVTVHLHTARMGVIIGKRGAEIDKLTEELQQKFGRVMEVKPHEVPRPEIDAQLVAEDIAEQLQKRAGFRRTIKRALEQTMDAGARGVKVLLSGRLGGAEMSRSEGGNLGALPLSTLRARIDYGFAEAKTAQGHIGVKVWINQGDYLSDESPEDAAAATARRRGPRRRGRESRQGAGA